MRRFQKGFSLVELMIVVAIIGILAAIAIPNFVTMQLKAKRSEVPSNVDGIKTAEMAYDAAFDGYISAALKPTGSANKLQQEWTANTSTEGWSRLGWKPDGKVRGTYQAATFTGGTCGSITDSFSPNFCVTGTSDVDDDADEVSYYATQNANATIETGGEDVF